MRQNSPYPIAIPECLFAQLCMGKCIRTHTRALIHMDKLQIYIFLTLVDIPESYLPPSCNMDLLQLQNLGVLNCAVTEGL